LALALSALIPVALDLPDVQPDRRRKVASSAPELRSRPAISLPSLARQLALLEVDEIKSVPHVPVSHPFVERLTGTIRREFFDHVLIWNSIDLERKLEEFRIYYNEHRVHQSLSGGTPGETIWRTTARACRP
jgi:hypothetical protein